MSTTPHRQCQGKVPYLDTPRYTGRGLNGFEREWTWRSCKRSARASGYCYQHEKQMCVDGTGEANTEAEPR